MWFARALSNQAGLRTVNEMALSNKHQKAVGKAYRYATLDDTFNQMKLGIRLTCRYRFANCWFQEGTRLMAALTFAV